MGGLIQKEIRINITIKKRKVRDIKIETTTIRRKI